MHLQLLQLPIALKHQLSRQPLSVFFTLHWFDDSVPIQRIPPTKKEQQDNDPQRSQHSGIPHAHNYSHPLTERAYPSIHSLPSFRFHAAQAEERSNSEEIAHLLHQSEDSLLEALNEHWEKTK